MAVPYAGLSDVGRKRSRNDDRWGADAALRLYMVADGVGSTSHGDLAAGLVVDMLPSYVARHFNGVDFRDPQAPERLGHAVVEMCTDLYTRSRSDANLGSADTTLVAALIGDSRAVIAHLGDSRAYLYRDRQVQRLTSDHTIVQAVMDAGELSAEEAAHHPNRSVVTRHVLMTPPAKPDFNAFDLQPGDRILLCSDGLHGLVDDATLAAILNEHPDPADACRVLIDAANQAGGHDNITAVVAYAAQAGGPPPGPAPTFVGQPPASAEATVPDVPVSAPTAANTSLAPTQRIPLDQPPAPRRTPPPVGAPPPPPPPPMSLPPEPPRRRRGGMWALIALAVVLLAAGGVVGYLLLGSHSPTPPAPAASPTSAAQSVPPSSTRSTLSPGPTLAVLPFGDLKHPKGVAVDNAGNVYVVDGDNARVMKWTPGSNTASKLPFTDLKDPYGIAVDGSGNVYVTDASGDGRVLELELAPGTSKQSELQFGKPGGNGLKHPAGIAVDATGSVYVADTGNDRVLTLTSGSDTAKALPFTELDHPYGVAVSAGGVVYVVDQDKDRVWKLALGSSNPEVLPFTDLKHPEGVAVDAAGNVYVGDSSNHRVVKLPSGAASQTVLPVASSLGTLTGVAVDPGGRVYVADDTNNRVDQLPAF